MSTHTKVEKWVLFLLFCLFFLITIDQFTQASIYHQEAVFELVDTVEKTKLNRNSMMSKSAAFFTGVCSLLCLSILLLVAVLDSSKKERPE